MHRKILAREKLVNRELFAKSFLINIHGNVLAYTLTVAYSPNFFLTNNFYLYGLPKFSPAKIFLCMICLTSVNQRKNIEQCYDIKENNYSTLLYFPMIHLYMHIKQSTLACKIITVLCTYMYIPRR